MDSLTTETTSPPPPLYKEALVGILVGVTLGPVVGWFIGTFATFFVVVLRDNSQHSTGAVRSMRGSAFWGGLVGILFGLITGPLVGLPLRIASVVLLKSLSKPWAGAAVGMVSGLGIGYLIYLYWDYTAEALLYLMIHSVIVGGAVGALTVMAKPKWL